MKFTAGFNPRDLRVIVEKTEREVIATYYSEFKGRDYFHVRSLFRDKTGWWCPGKGLSMEAGLADEFCTRIGNKADLAVAA